MKMLSWKELQLQEEVRALLHQCDVWVFVVS